MGRHRSDALRQAVMARLAGCPQGEQSRIAKELRITQQAVSRWRLGRNLPDDECWERLEELLGWDAGTMKEIVRAEDAARTTAHGDPPPPAARSHPSKGVEGPFADREQSTDPAAMSTTRPYRDSVDMLLENKDLQQQLAESFSDRHRLAQENRRLKELASDLSQEIGEDAQRSADAIANLTNLLQHYLRR